MHRKMAHLKAELAVKLDALEYEHLHRKSQLDALLRKTCGELHTEYKFNWSNSAARSLSGMHPIVTTSFTTKTARESRAQRPSRCSVSNSTRNLDTLCLQRTKQYVHSPASAQVNIARKFAVVQPPNPPLEACEREPLRGATADAPTSLLEFSQQERRACRSSKVRDKPLHHSNTSETFDTEESPLPPNERATGSKAMSDHYTAISSPAKITGESQLRADIEHIDSQHYSYGYMNAPNSAQEEIEKLTAYHRAARTPLLSIEALVFAGIKTRSLLFLFIQRLINDKT